MEENGYELVFFDRRSYDRDVKAYEARVALGPPKHICMSYEAPKMPERHRYYVTKTDVEEKLRRLAIMPPPLRDAGSVMYRIHYELEDHMPGIRNVDVDGFPITTNTKIIVRLFEDYPKRDDIEKKLREIDPSIILECVPGAGRGPQVPPSDVTYLNK